MYRRIYKCGKEIVASKVRKCSICENNYDANKLTHYRIIKEAWLQLSTGRILKLPKDISVSHNRRVTAIE
jgi:uncharacterized protein YktA (UPF0223 family)